LPLAFSSESSFQYQLVDQTFTTFTNSSKTVAVRVFLWFLGFVINLKDVNWDNELIHGMEFIEHSVLQVPFFLMTLMRHITPTLDNV